jgi:hypothetical protein
MNKQLKTETFDMMGIRLPVIAPFIDKLLMNRISMVRMYIKAYTNRSNPALIYSYELKCRPSNIYYHIRRIKEALRTNFNVGEYKLYVDYLEEI